MNGSRCRDERGVVIPLVALLLPVVILMTAFAVDLGRQRSSRRTMQARADVIALDMVRLANGRDAFTIYNDSATEEALKDSAQRNDIPRDQIIEVVWGVYAPAIAGPLPFQPHHQAQFSPANDPTLIPDAVKIVTTETTDYFFQPGSGEVTRTALATQSGTIDLKVGSVGAALQTPIPGGAVGVDATVDALNARLQTSFGVTVPPPGAVGLTAAGYQGLAATDIDLWQMAQTGGFASPNELLDEEFTAGELLSLTATALDPNTPTAAAQVRALSNSIASGSGLDSTNTIRLGDFLDFAQGGDDAAASGSVKVLDLLSGAADVIDGKHFLSYSFDPHFGNVKVNVQQYIVSPPRWEYGLRVGQSSSNKQASFQVTLDLPPLLGMVGRVRVPLIVNAATATGTVKEIRCGDAPADRQADIKADTTLLSVELGTATNASTGNFAPALEAQARLLVSSSNLTLAALVQLGVTGLLSITNDLTAWSHGDLGGANNQILTFTPDVPPNPSQRAVGGLGTATIGAQLAANLDAKYGISGFSGLITSHLASQLNYVFTNFDALIIGPLLRSTGLTIGGADVWTDNLECQTIKLVG